MPAGAYRASSWKLSLQGRPEALGWFSAVGLAAGITGTKQACPSVETPSHSSYMKHPVFSGVLNEKGHKRRSS
jgi:hypothetical protein